jgi:hypothetical protein
MDFSPFYKYLDQNANRGWGFGLQAWVDLARAARLVTRALPAPRTTSVSD